MAQKAKLGKRPDFLIYLKTKLPSKLIEKADLDIAQIITHVAM